MKTFLRKICLYGGIIGLFLGILSVTVSIPADNYLQAYKAKCTLLKNVASPRIIFVGGSNLAFGLDSRRIKDSLHVNVINYGLHAGIGLKYMLDDVDDYLRDGDIIVLSPEYQHFFGGAYGGPSTITPLLYLSDWKNVGKLDFRQWKNVLAGIPKIFQLLTVTTKTERSYCASGFNELGDEVKHWNLSSIPIPPVDGLGNLDRSFLTYFVAKVGTWRKRCTVVITPPVYMQREYEKNKQKIADLQRYLDEHECPFEIAPEQHVMPDEYAYDTMYHMNKRGVDEFTTRLIRELRGAVTMK